MIDRPNVYRVLDLFSGIGGFSLGLSAAGMQTVAFCESDGYARRVLRKHWPYVWLYEDVRTLTAKRLKKDGLDPNVICGGFPCQDISCAGKGAGIEGERSGLWGEFARIIREVRPEWVVAENVPALRGRGADRVLADLEGAGYSAWPVVVGAWAVGAPHQRDRVWIVGHAERYAPKLEPSFRVVEDAAPSASPVANADRQRRLRSAQEQRAGQAELRGAPAGVLANSEGRRIDDVFLREANARVGFPDVPHPAGSGLQARRANGVGKRPPKAGAPAQRHRWEAQCPVRRVADGVPHRVDRLRTLGNAVVPLIVELIGRAIIEQDQRSLSA